MQQTVTELTESFLPSVSVIFINGMLYVSSY